MTQPRRPYAGETFLADKSAWVRAQSPRVNRQFASALRNGQIATCPIVNLELLYSARDRKAFDALAADLARLRDIPITRSVTNAAQRALRQLAHMRPPRHRTVPLPDLLIAAAAEEAAVGVLHYDEHFDTLAEVLAFESRWIARRGSL
jgi:predicted nucleic acid-binding protein